MRNHDIAELERYSAEELELLGQVELERNRSISVATKLKLLRANYVAETLQEPDRDIDWLAEQATAVELGAKRRRRPSGDVAATFEPNLNQTTLLRILTMDAREHAGAVRFRREILRGRLVKLDNVPAWVERRATADGPHTRWVEVPIDSDHVPSHPTDAPPGTRFTLRLLSYRGIDTAMLAKPVANGGVLDRLRLLADNLHQSYGWHPAIAATFVLTDLMLGRESTVTRTMRSPFPAAGTITIEVSPEMSPDKVKAMYAAVRKQMGMERARPITEKHAELAVFVAERRSGHSWKELKQEWNAIHEEWGYSEYTNFSRDARTAYQRVTGMQLNWIGNTDRGHSTEDQR